MSSASGMGAEPGAMRSGNTRSFSLIVTSYNSAAMTVFCLQSIRDTLPAWFTGDVIVIDDASRAEECLPIEEFCSAHGFRLLQNESNLGYTRSCNRAAAEATGDILVLLNNDTELLPGWLEAFAAAFERYPDAGAIGGMLLYPDGRLQEAGGAVFSDGSSWNVGRGGDPDAPLCNFTREVDYCSGAFLATPRSVWTRAGGYDVSLSPIYYEDTSYCFAVRRLGLRVLFEPSARIIHIEGATSGTDAGSGLKRHQVRNRKKFVAAWAGELENREPAPLYLDHSLLHRVVFDPMKPRVLMLGHDLPEYDKEGGSKVMFDAAALLREEGWNVTWAAPSSRADERYAVELQRIGVPVFRHVTTELPAGPFPTELERLVVTGAFDVILIYFWHIAHEWAPALRRLSPRSRIVIHTIDLHLLREARRVLRTAEGDDEPLLGEIWALEARMELNAYARADRVLAVSEKEARLIDDLTGKPGLASVLPLMDDVQRSTIPFRERRGIVFLASFRHPPNLEAARYLFEEIVPRLDPQLLAEHPLTVIGTDLDESVRQLARGIADVNLVGWVPSVYPYLEGARVSVIPLLHGAGTKNKLVQACMIGTPSVCTSVGVEGLDLVAGRDVAVADDPDSFASAIERLLSDEASWSTLADNGRRAVERRHGREQVREKLLEALKFTEVAEQFQ